eukprot:SAG31_NODE_2672_length_5268_cov_41.402273_5_plen_95_part_00
MRHDLLNYQLVPGLLNLLFISLLNLYYQVLQLYVYVPMSYVETGTRTRYCLKILSQDTVSRYCLSRRAVSPLDLLHWRCGLGLELRGRRNAYAV